MPSSTSVTEPRTIRPVGPASAEPTAGALVLDRVAARVRQRLEAEGGEAGDGTHAASLIWPCPL